MIFFDDTKLKQEVEEVIKSNQEKIFALGPHQVKFFIQELLMKNTEPSADVWWEVSTTFNQDASERTITVTPILGNIELKLNRSK